MAIDLNDLVEGLDPSGLIQISGAQLLQMVRNAVAADSKFFGIFDESEPDVVTTPRYARYSWFKPSEISSPVERRWSGTEWIPVSIGDEVITSAMIEDGAITLAKLYNPGGEALKLLRVNAGGTGFELWTLENPVKSVTLAMLSSAGGTNNQFIHVNAFGGFEFFDLIATNYIPANSITPDLFFSNSVPGDQYRVNAAGTEVEFFSPPSALIADRQYISLAGNLTKDLTFLKPSTAQWDFIEVYCNLNFTDAVPGINASMKCDLTFQTAPNIGTALTGGNSGTVFVYGTSAASAYLNGLTIGRMRVPAGLQDVDSIIVRAAFTAGQISSLINNGQFYGTGWYVNDIT